MMRENSPPRSTSLVLLPLVLAAALLSPVRVMAKGCSESPAPGAQANTVPQSLWGELQSIGVLSDATNYNGNQLANSQFPQITSVDIENGFLFASYWAGLQIWDLRSDPQHPTKLSTIDGWLGDFPQWVPGASEIDEFLYAIDAPEGDDSIVALGGLSPTGLSIWDTRNKSAPVALYQDATSKSIQQVWAATIGGRAYAFAAALDGGPGVHVYDMTAARSLNKCVEDVTAGVRNCPGVYIGQVGGANSAQYVHGMQLNGHTYLAKSAGLNPPHAVEIWDVSTPSNPSLVGSGYTGPGLANFTTGVAIWSQGSSAYLAVHLADHVDILILNSCLTRTCAALPGAMASFPTARVAESDNWKSVVFSRAGSTPMLFI